MIKLTLDDLASIYPEQLFLEFSSAEREQAWQQTQNYNYSNPAARWNAYLNYLCLNVFSSYLETETDLQLSPTTWLQKDDLFGFWQLVNGTAIELNSTRLILIVNDISDFTELRVQREWVELPHWAGNYYLAVQVNLEECYLRVWGYTTHQQLYNQGKRDRLDETYSLAVEELTEDLTAMWLAQELYPSPRPQLPPVPTLSTTEAETLLQQLSQPLPYSPRLEVPFTQWGALMENEQCRTALCQRQQQDRSLPQLNTTEATLTSSQSIADISPTPTPSNLGRWFQQVFDNGWQSLEGLLNSGSSNLALSYSFRTSSLKNQNFAVEGVKIINLGIELGDRAVALAIGLMPERENKVGIRVQLHPTSGNRYLPAQIKLVLLSQSDKILQEVQARSQDNLIQLKRFFCPVGKSFRIKVVLAQFSLSEDFLITPQELDE